MAILETIVIAFWAMLPAYVPNNAPRCWPAAAADRRRPDVGRQARTGRREDLARDGDGILAGLALAAVLTLVKPAASDALGFAVPEFTPLAALGLAGGAMLGDILASFLKRRSGRQRGAMFRGLDQLDFRRRLPPAGRPARFRVVQRVVHARGHPRRRGAHADPPRDDEHDRVQTGAEERALVVAPNGSENARDPVCFSRTRSDSIRSARNGDRSTFCPSIHTLVS